MINGISLNANSYNYSGLVSSGHGKLYVPVAQSNVIYAHFDHVTGVAAKPNQSGVSISKIQILNSLLNQLISMKNQPKLDVKPENMSDSIHWKPHILRQFRSIYNFFPCVRLVDSYKRVFNYF